MIDVGRLRTLAQQAQPRWHNRAVMASTTQAEYIATVSPDVLLALLDENQRMRGRLADFANPQHWAIDRSYDPPKTVWIGTYHVSPVDHAREALT